MRTPENAIRAQRAAYGFCRDLERVLWRVAGATGRLAGTLRACGGDEAVVAQVDRARRRLGIQVERLGGRATLIARRIARNERAGRAVRFPESSDLAGKTRGESAGNTAKSKRNEGRTR